MLCGVHITSVERRTHFESIFFSRWVSSITISVVVTSDLFSQTGQILEITLVCEMVSRDKWLLRHVVACGFPLTSFGFVWDWDGILLSTMVNRNHTTIWGIYFIFSKHRPPRPCWQVATRWEGLEGTTTKTTPGSVECSMFFRENAGKTAEATEKSPMCWWIQKLVNKRYYIWILHWCFKAKGRILCQWLFCGPGPLLYGSNASIRGTKDS